MVKVLKCGRALLVHSGMCVGLAGGERQHSAIDYMCVY